MASIATKLFPMIPGNERQRQAVLAASVNGLLGSQDGRRARVTMSANYEHGVVHNDARYSRAQHPGRK